MGGGGRWKVWQHTNVYDDDDDDDERGGELTRIISLGHP